MRKFSESKTYKKLCVFLREMLYLIKCNWKITLPFLVVYSVFNIIATSAVVHMAMILAMRLKGITYVGPDNIISFFTAPTTIVIFFFCVSSLVFYMLWRLPESCILIVCPE